MTFANGFRVIVNDHDRFRRAIALNTMGCSFLILAGVALVVGFIPILTWITVFVALPLSLMGAVASGNIARRHSAQPADKAIFWIAIAVAATIIFRILTLP